MNSSLRTNTLFEQIIREEYTRALFEKRMYALEAKGTLYTTSNVDPEYAKNPQQPWTGTSKKAHDVLKSMGAQSYSLGINDDGLELLLYMNGKPTDRLQFYSDGRVYSSDNTETLGWKLKGSSIQLTEKPDSNEPVGIIKQSGNSNNYILDPGKEQIRKQKELEVKKAKEYTKYEAIADRVHTVLDYLGFLPGIGDIADLINAAWYFADGKYLDAALSAIAIVPIIGSAAAVTLKTGFKTIGKGYTKLLGKGVSDSSALWKKFIDSGTMDRQTLKGISEFTMTAADQLKPNVISGWLNKVPFISKQTEEQILKHCDEFSTYLKNHASSMNRSTTGGHIGGIGAGAKYAETASNYENIIGIIAKQPEAAAKIAGKVETKMAARGGRFRKLMGRFLGVLGNTPWFKPKKIDAIVDSMGKTFKKQFMHPTKITMLLTHMPNQNVVLGQLQKIMAERFALLSKSGVKIPDKFKSFNFVDATPSEINQIFRRLNGQDAVFKDISKDLADNVIGQSVKGNNPLWVIYKSDQTNQLKTLLSKELMTNPKAWGAQFGDIRKWYDIFGSEIEDAVETTGAIPNDERNGFIVDAILAKVNEKNPELGGLIGKMSKAAVENPYMQTFTRKAKELVGYDSTTGYNPNAKKGGIYNK